LLYDEQETLQCMARRTQRGSIRQSEHPVWQPLLDLVGEQLVEWFMWMYEVELADQSALHAYKHVATRRYFHLAENGRAFAYRSHARYAEISPCEAIDEAFNGWEELLPQPRDPEAVRAVLRRARLRN
jgi:hypothetical protein